MVVNVDWSSDSEMWPSLPETVRVRSELCESDKLVLISVTWDEASSPLDFGSLELCSLLVSCEELVGSLVGVTVRASSELEVAVSAAAESKEEAASSPIIQ